MTEVVTIKFRGRGKAYYFDPAGITAAAGEQLVVETSKGMELGSCVEGNHMVEDSDTVQPLRPVVRKATADDLRVAEINRSREAEAFEICKDMIKKHQLEMKLVDVECSFEGNKILFFFTADGRVDFRELVKDLAGVFRTRIELRQIGVRDEAKMLGGLGICGRPFCCNQFLEDFQPVSTKMAKTQSMSLNPVKISGTCGRLMCCLRYEQEAYEDLVKHVPKNGAFVQTVDGYGSVTLVNLLRQNVKVKLDGPGDAVVRTYTVDEIAEVPGGRPPEGEPLPQVLHYVPKPKEEPEPEPRWSMPQMLPEEEERAPAAAPEAAGEGQSKSSRRRRHKKKSQGGDAPVVRVEKVEKPDRPEKADKPHAVRGKGQPSQPRQKSPAAPGQEEKRSHRPNHRRRGGKPRQDRGEKPSGTP
ncbi:MAG: hypothetical protein IJT62_02525 [Oscillospiraceae bacterium]|nr:hypothetical protein [Oscillospiraceae bacterium]